MANPLGKMRILWTEVVSAQEDDNNKMQVDSVIDKSAGDGTNGPQDKERKEVSQRRWRKIESKFIRYIFAL